MNKCMKKTEQCQALNIHSANAYAIVIIAIIITIDNSNSF